MSPSYWKREAGAPVFVSGQPPTLFRRVWQRLKTVPISFTLAFLTMGIIVTLVVGLLLGAYLTASLSTDASRFVGNNAVATAKQLEVFLESRLVDGSLDNVDAGALERYVDADLIDESVLRLNVWTSDGSLAYSTESQLVEKEDELGERLGAALGGEVVVFLDRSKILEAYAPLRLGESQQVVGAVEIKSDYDTVDAQIAATKRRVYLGIGVSIGGLFMALLLLVKRDSDRMHKQQTQLLHAAYHDPLTGLPNRRLFSDRLTVAIALAQRQGDGLGVVLIDMDHFKLLNDSWGHTSGDELLQGVANRLKDAIRDGDTVARLGGDEFVLVLPGIRGPDDLDQVAETLLSKLQERWQLGHRDFQITASAGIAIYPQDGKNAENLLKNADSAMYAAKEAGRNTHRFYNAAMNAKFMMRFEMERALRRALQEGEFVVHYQPVVDVATGEIVSAEALVRWQDPEQGLIGPGEFIAVAEETGLIVPLGEWVLRSACLQTKAWREAGLAHLGLAVNLSGRQFRHADLVASIRQVLKDTRLDPSCLQLEITETIAMQDIELSVATLASLRDLGLQTAVDDFGTGYSSLAYLKDLPMDTLKIDRSFLENVATDSRDAVIVANTIALAHGLHLTVIAEGIETEEQLSFLREHHCDQFQGFLFSEPLPAAAFERLLSQAKKARIRPADRKAS
ncbi:MAG: EAL domain-containing protein [Chloroflexi bacterium]|nr:EAL domain-containing protein [Chloroflexota bacterium]